MSGKARCTTIGAVIISVLIVGGLAWKFRPPVRTHKMPDGTVMRLEKIAFGKENTQYRPLSLREKARDLITGVLPPALKKKFLPPPPPLLGGWWTTGTQNAVHTNMDALQLWFTRRDATNGLTNVGLFRGVIIDEAGCEFPSTLSGGNFASSPVMRALTRSYSGPDASTCNWLTFEAFPRRERRFRLQLLSQSGARLADFIIENPAPRPALAKWSTRSVPMTNFSGNTAFALTSASVRSQPTAGLGETLARMILPAANQNYRPSHAIVPTFEVLESGKLSPEWQADRIELWDSTGNCVSQTPGNENWLFLSPREPAWKLVVKFFGSEHAASASNAVTKLAAVPVPAPGEFMMLDRDLDVGGSIVHPVSVGGAGQIVYSNNLPIGASRLNDSLRYNSVQYTNAAFGGQLMTLNSSTPELAFRLGSTLNENQRLTVRAVDGQGREYYGQDWMYGGGGTSAQAKGMHYLDPNRLPRGMALVSLSLPLPPDVTNVDLYFCIHNSLTEEFIFKPPTNQ